MSRHKNEFTTFVPLKHRFNFLKTALKYEFTNTLLPATLSIIIVTTFLCVYNQDMLLTVDENTKGYVLDPSPVMVVLAVVYLICLLYPLNSLILCLKHTGVDLDRNLVNIVVLHKKATLGVVDIRSVFVDSLYITDVEMTSDGYCVLTLKSVDVDIITITAFDMKNMSEDTLNGVLNRFAFGASGVDRKKSAKYVLNRDK